MYVSLLVCYQKTMNFIKSLLSPRSRQKQSVLVAELVLKVGLKGTKQLKDNYQKELINSLAKSNAPDKFIKILLSEVDKMDKVEQLAKLFTLIHGTVRYTEYEGLVMETLEHMDLVIDRNFNSESTVWFKNLYTGYISYLAKLPSISQVYIRAKTTVEGTKIDKKNQLVDLFRIVNQVGLFLESLINAFNAVGRYYKSSKEVYMRLYKTLSSELLQLYEYMRIIVNRMFVEYEYVDRKDLVVFLQSIPQIELITDKLQQFLNCKYFDGMKIQLQIYFKADQIEKLRYYLEVGNKQKQSVK